MDWQQPHKIYMHKDPLSFFVYDESTDRLFEFELRNQDRLNKATIYDCLVNACLTLPETQSQSVREHKCRSQKCGRTWLLGILNVTSLGSKIDFPKIRSCKPENLRLVKLSIFLHLYGQQCASFCYYFSHL